MAMRLLVGLDQREGGEDALELARVLGLGADASALVVTTLSTGPLPMSYALLPEEETEEAGPLFAMARERLGDIEVETRAYGGGSPAGILTTLAEEEDFDAIVVGSPHRGAVGRVMIGSVALSLLNGAPTDVAVAPKGYAQSAHEAPRQIAVAYDGSPESKAALRRAEALAQPSGTIRVITVVRPPVGQPTMAPGIVYLPAAPLHPEKIIDEALKSVDPSLAAEGSQLEGDPAQEIIGACEAGTDLLVVGSRGYGPVTRVLLGSVSREVARMAPCPVLVARRP